MYIPRLFLNADPTTERIATGRVFTPVSPACPQCVYCVQRHTMAPTVQYGSVLNFPDIVISGLIYAYLIKSLLVVIFYTYLGIFSAHTIL